MSKSKGKGKKLFKFFFKAGTICAYIALVVVLILQALTPGEQSEQMSEQFGNKVDEVVTQIHQPQNQHVPVQNVVIDSIKIDGKTSDTNTPTIFVGKQGKIYASVLPDDATNASLTYKSSDKEVAKVYSDGRIVALSVGSAVITVCSQENEDIKTTVAIVVEQVPVQSVTIGNLPDEIHAGQSFYPEGVFAPEDTTQTDLIWSSSDDNVFVVDDKGKVTAKAQGVATLTATSVFDDDIFDTAQLTILPQEITPVVPVQSIAIVAGSLVGYKGKSQQLVANLLPAEAEDSVTWSTSDKSIATVSQKGVIKFRKAGQVTITAKCCNFDKQDSVTFVVKEVLSQNIVLDGRDMSLQEGAFVLRQGETGKLVATLDEDATVLDVSFESSDDDVAQIGADGIITAKKGGRVTITATTSYDGRSTVETVSLVVEKTPFAETIKNFYMWVRKAFGHFGAFLVLGILATMSYYMIFSKSTKGKLIGFAVCMFAGFAVAGITEILQLPVFTPGRTASLDDVWIDFKGYCCSALVIYLVIFAIHFGKMIAKRKNKTK
ncbi:MAG: VanZ family protein [Clostridia bacterium]|nr:VanZ family protein [Clostridia bacterium]